MNDPFDIPVNYKDKELMIPAQLRTIGYTYRIEAEVDGVLLYFERDDAGAFRALVPPETPDKVRLPDAALVAAITTALNELLA